MYVNQITKLIYPLTQTWKMGISALRCRSYGRAKWGNRDARILKEDFEGGNVQKHSLIVNRELKRNMFRFNSNAHIRTFFYSIIALIMYEFSSESVDMFNYWRVKQITIKIIDCTILLQQLKSESDFHCLHFDRTWSDLLYSVSFSHFIPRGIFRGDCSHKHCAPSSSSDL